MSIVEALSNVMKDVGSVAKRDRNEAQGFSFRGIDAVVSAVSPALREHGVVVLPTVREIRATTVEVGRNRTLMGHVSVTVRYRFVGPDGDHLDCVTVGEAMDSGDKATPKAMSVAFRTALLQALCLPTDDPDPDTQTYERAAAREPQNDDVQTLLAEIRQLATTVGVATREIEDDWAAAHDGQFIGDATDIGYLTLLRDDLKARAT